MCNLYPIHDQPGRCADAVPRVEPLCGQPAADAGRLPRLPGGVAHRNHHEFARGKPRRTLSSQLSGKLTDSTLSAPYAELAAVWRSGLAELTVAFAKRSLSSRFVETFTIPPLIVRWARARSISAELTLVSE